MRILERLVKVWAYLSMFLCMSVIIFLFVFVFIKGMSKLSFEFILSSPKGMVLGTGYCRKFLFRSARTLFIYSTCIGIGAVYNIFL